MNAAHSAAPNPAPAARHTLLKYLGMLLSAGALLVIGYSAWAAEKSNQDLRAAASLAQRSGNIKDAYEIYAKLLADPNNLTMGAPEDLRNAVQCLQQLGRVDETDDLIEKAVATQPKNWRLLHTAADVYGSTEQQGFIIAGKFYRGSRHGNDGKFVSTFERSRVRSLQLMVQAADAAKEDKDKEAVANFYFRFADFMLDRRRDDGAWRFQYLTDLTKLPDYEEAMQFYRGGFYGGGGGNGRGAPVDEKGNPVLHKLPKSWDDAKTDGERWRWCLLQASEFSPAVANRARFVFANFLQDQFGVQTMLEGGFPGRRMRPMAMDARSAALPGAQGDDDTRKDESGPFAVQTLKENETIARLANGIKRFALPDEFNPIKIFQELGDAAPGTEGENSLGALAQIFQDRQQFDRAAEFLNKSIARFGAGPNNFKKDQIQQIVGNWGEFDPAQSVPAGKEPNLSFIFRNGSKVSFTAREIDVGKLLNDVKAYLKGQPQQLNWQELQIENVGYRIVVERQNQYLGKEVARWDVDLKPRAKHFDKRQSVKVPLQKAGAYLVTAKMADGNTTRVVLWMSDTVLVKKGLDNGSYYYVADAASGAPISKAKLDFFGWRQMFQENGKKPQTETKEFAEFTDADGQLALKPDQAAGQYQWLITAGSEDGRFAYMGYTGVWSGQAYDPDYNQNKVFTITDRPVYRPGQTMKFKTWIGQAKYDQDTGPSPFAGKVYTVRTINPKGEVFFEKVFTADEFGGFDGELHFAADATLGTYSIQVLNPGNIHAVAGDTFRLEEYKKPEFEVKVDAPTEPVMLGDKIAATITAKYYFGAPVVSAKVKYKVTRTDFRAEWFPAGRWDWMYGKGYWWFGCDYPWYPGFLEWGIRRPFPFWFPMRGDRPEVVMENEVPVGADGTVKVEIDTAVAKAMHGDTDHKYEISAEVTDESRRTIVGTGTVSVARKPFKVYAWVDRGYYQTGDVIAGEFQAQTLDNKPIKGKGELKLLAVAYAPDGKPEEREVQKWNLDTDDQGHALQQLKADRPGQFRLSYTVTDTKGHTIEGGYVFVIRGDAFNGKQFRFNDIEITADKREYAPGDKLRLMINTNRDNGTVLLFARPTNGIYLPPKVLRLNGKSTVEEVGIVQKDMPNFFVEVLTVSGGRVYTETREIVVPPDRRVVNVEVIPNQKQYKPGEKAKVQIKLTSATGEPIVGSTVVSMYDKSVEYVAGGSNVPDIKEFFWKWRRSHMPQTETTASRTGGPIHPNMEITLQYLGRFGHMIADLPQEEEMLANADQTVAQENFAELSDAVEPGFAARGGAGSVSMRGAAAPALMAMAARKGGDKRLEFSKALGAADAAGRGDAGADGAAAPDVEPTVRSNFADTAYWSANLKTNANGIAELELPMPENLTTWKTKVWTLAPGTRVGEGSAEVTTYKNLIVRLQAPRFFVQKDQVVLSANVHNYLKTEKTIKVRLDMPGSYLAPLGEVQGLTQTVSIPAGGERRVDWWVKVVQPGQAIVKMSALTDEESDATQMSFPVYIHGMLKTESYSGALRLDEKGTSLTVNVPAERLPEQSRIEIRYSPSVAAAMVDALPYLVDYPYGCTEQTLNRFLPTVITQRVLLNMGLDLKDIQKKRTNLNAQEIGEDAKRAEDWKRNNPTNPGMGERNPVFDSDEVVRMTKDGVERLTNMQCADGGWGWFSGMGERSYPHTTALVVHGLQIAKANDVALVPGLLERGVEWLKRYQKDQVDLIKRAPALAQPYKENADDLDAFVFMVLTDAGVKGQDASHDEMRDFLYRDRTHLSVYTKAQFGLALVKLGDQPQKLDMILQNISQFVVKDNENQTAYLRLPEGFFRYYWYGTDTEAMGFYLKLLAKTDPKGDTAPKLAKYLITNRKHASYWNSTRDTAICIEALADYIKASGEDKPDLTVAISIDGKKAKEVKIDAGNFFSFDNKLVLAADQVTTGQHKIEFAKTGKGPLYFNAYVTNFTLEDPIKKAGLEIRVDRKFYKLTPANKTEKVSGSRGQALDQKVEAYDRTELKDLSTLTSGELIEVELEIDSKNDYEYLLFEDMKASGFEPMDLRSGYNGNDLNAYMELRDERVCFFARTLARGKHSVSYRLRSEIPGKFSAMPTKASALYAPELKANSDEFKVNIQDAPPMPAGPATQPAAK